MVLKLAKLSLIFSAIFAVSNCEGHHNATQFLSINQTLNGLKKKPGANSGAAADVKYFVVQQPVDHLNLNETRFWKMRYIVNDDFHEPGGPLFIFVGGGAITSSEMVTSGHIFDMARVHKAYLVHTELRFYGESRPFMETTVENLQFLSTVQALADLARLIQIVQNNFEMRNSKVILFGCSYGADLVTWFNKLYPRVAVGGWASSASLLAKVNYKELTVITGQSILSVGGIHCYYLILNGIAKLEQMVARNESAELKRLLNICDNFDVGNNLDVSNLFFNILWTFSNIVQNHVYNEIQTACNEMLNEVDGFQGFIKFVKSKAASESCLDYTYATTVRLYLLTDFDSGTDRQRLYQQCNEFGQFETTDYTKQPFGNNIPLEYFMTLCRDVFGNGFTQDYLNLKVRITNNMFRGLNPDVDNVYFTQGELDPWKALGIVEKGEITILPKIGRCQDFRSISEPDSPFLKSSKIRIMELVAEWQRN